MLFYILTLVIFCGHSKSYTDQVTSKFNTHNDSVLLKQICQMDLNSFVGQKVEKFTQTIQTDIQNKTPHTEPPQVLTGYFLQYSEQIVVDVIVTEFAHLKPFNLEGNWDFSLFEREELARIKIYFQDEIIYDSLKDRNCNF